MRTADELRHTFEAYLGTLPLAPELGRLEEVLRYALESRGKRIRPVLCLAVADALRGTVEETLHAAGALEIVHTFYLVRDDLPALDDDAERRGRPSTHVAFGDGVAVLAGDALLVEAFRLALSYDDPAIARELADAAVGMIGGQYRDVTNDDKDLAEVERLKTGSLFSASVGLALHAVGEPVVDQAPWRAFGDELGPLFQVVDDVLDGDGFAERLGVEEARQLADHAAERARERLVGLPADTSVLGELVDGLAVRTA
ncbi:MAG: polyprenyl synthetase family protein [Gaiellaceae bacterium]